MEKYNLTAAIKAALNKSGEILMNHFGNLKEYESKENQCSIVTQADIESEKEIINIIEKQFPDHNIIAEETGYRDNKSDYTWIVDPLDGTSNFAAGIPWFGILIGVLKNNVPFKAGVYLPFYDQLYYAEEGKASTLNDKPISVSKETELKNILLSYSLDYCKDFTKTDYESKIIAKLVNSIRNLRSTNSVIDHSYAADGRLGASINQTTKIWDIAAPYLIIKQAGGVATDVEGKELNFDVNEKNYDQNYTIVASNKDLHPKILKIINSINNR